MYRCKGRSQVKLSPWTNHFNFWQGILLTLDTAWRKETDRFPSMGTAAIPNEVSPTITTITRLKFLSEQQLGVRVNFRFNQVSSWWRHNHIFENAWRFYHNNNYQFHLQNTYTFCVSKGHIRSFESHIWNNTSSWSSKITLVLTLVQEIQVFIMYN